MNFLVGDKVAWLGNSPHSVIYTRLTRSGTVVKVTQARVVVQWDNHTGKARPYKPTSLMKLVKVQ